MRIAFARATFALLLAVSSAPAVADISRGRDLMEANRFKKAMQEFLPAAQAGNADAAISQEEVVKKMTKRQIEDAHILIDDYKPHLFPHLD